MGILHDTMGILHDTMGILLPFSAASYQQVINNGVVTSNQLPVPSEEISFTVNC